MKQVLVVAVMLVVIAREGLAQGVDVHNRLGESGSHVTLQAGLPSFSYEATITGATVPLLVTLEVYHNGVLSFTDSRPLFASTLPFLYASLVPAGSWRPGDSVLFVLKVTNPATGDTVATHSLIGDVAGP